MIKIYLEVIASSQVIQVLVPLMVLDYLSGVIAAAVNHQLSSKIGYKGFLKKIIMILGITSVAIVQGSLPDVPYLLTSFVLFFILNEVISIIENLDRAGVKLPGMLVRLLITKRDEFDQE
jgi:toxin secretion/phage lysis holin